MQIQYNIYIILQYTHTHTHTHIYIYIYISVYIKLNSTKNCFLSILIMLHSHEIISTVLWITNALHFNFKQQLIGTNCQENCAQDTEPTSSSVREVWLTAHTENIWESGCTHTVPLAVLHLTTSYDNHPTQRRIGKVGRLNFFNKILVHLLL